MPARSRLQRPLNLLTHSSANVSEKINWSEHIIDISYWTHTVYLAIQKQNFEF